MEILKKIEFDILFYLQSIHNPILDKPMIFITILGNFGCVWFIISIILMIIKKYRKYGILLFCSIVLTGLVGSFIMKPIFSRQRPCDIYQNIELLIKIPVGASFPSGHAAISFAAATVLGFMNRKLGIFAFILAGLIAFSRVYLFVHFPTDVLAGAALGILLSMFTIYIYKLLNRKKA